jgi:hypothetical protein
MTERIIKYYGLEVKLKLDIGVGIGGDKWPAAELFCDIIAQERYSDVFHKLFDGKRIIELGSGTGLCGIAIDKLFEPSKVLVTDLLVSFGDFYLICRNIVLVYHRVMLGICNIILI